MTNLGGTMSRPVFRSEDGYYAVFPCQCGCDGHVKVTGIMEHECGRSQYYYIRGHQAVGTTYEHIGARFDWEGVQQPLQAFAAPTHSATPAHLEKVNTAAPSALYDAWDDDTTPSVRLWWSSNDDQ
jgi:hypothetical protein